MNLGIIGAGNISRTHARAAETVPDTRVVAVWGGNAEKVRQLAERHGATACESLDALVRHPGLEAVCIGSPSGQHADQAMAAARQGLHLLVEKPLDISTACVDRLLDVVARHGVTLGVCFQDRLAPDVLRMKRAIADGSIGTIAAAAGHVQWYRPPEYYAASRWRGTWALDGGGALMNQGIHTVDLLLYLLGPVAQVSGAIATRFHDIEVEDTAVATLRFTSGVVATVSATTAAYPGSPRRVEIVGSSGSLLLEADRLVRADAAAGRGADLRTDVTGPAENARSPVVSDVSAHRRVLEDFFDAIRTGRAPACDGVEGRRSVAVVEAIYRAAREQIVVPVSDGADWKG